MLEFEKEFHNDNWIALSRNAVPFAQQESGSYSTLSFLPVLEMLVHHETILQLFMHIKAFSSMQRNESYAEHLLSWLQMS